MGKRWENGKQRLTTWWEKDEKRMRKIWKWWKKIGKLGKRLGKSLEAYGKMIGRRAIMGTVCDWLSHGNVTGLLGPKKGQKHTGIFGEIEPTTLMSCEKQGKLKGNGEKPILQNWDWNKCNHNYRMPRWKGRMEENIQPKPVRSWEKK